MSVSLARELTLHSYIPLTSLLFQGPEQKKKKKKRNLVDSLTTPPVEKVLQTCRWDPEKKDKRNRQAHRRTGRCLTDREGESDGHKKTDRQTGRVYSERQTGELLEGFTGSSPGYINSSSSGLNLAAS